MAPVIEDGGNQPAGVVQEPDTVASDQELALNRSELNGDDYLNINSLFPENTVFLTPNTPEAEDVDKAEESNADQTGHESTVPKDLSYLTQSEATEPKASSVQVVAAVPSETYGANPSYNHNERPISPIPTLDFSCLTIGGQVLDDPLDIFNTLEPFILDQPSALSNGIDDLNLSQTKFNELHSAPATLSTVEQTTDEQSIKIEPDILAEPALTPAVSPVEQIVDPQSPPIQMAIAIDPSAVNTTTSAPQTVQWRVMIPPDDATIPSAQPTPGDQPIDPVQSTGQQTILIYNPHATTQEAALTSVDITPPPTVDLSLQNMLVAAARQKQAKSSPSPVMRHNVIPVVSYSRDQLTVIPTPTNPATSQSCAEFFSNFTDEVGVHHPMETTQQPTPATGISPPSGYLEIPSNYVVSSNGKQQIFKVHELYKAPLLHPLVVEENELIVNSAQPEAAPPKPTTGKKRQRRTDIDYATGFECKPCQKTFGKKGSLEQHKRSHHSEPRPYLCKQCGKSFPTVEKLHQHQQNHLPGNKRFQCTDCEKRYVHAKDRDRHYLAHHGTGTFPCEQCPKAFARRDHLLAHIVSHRKREERAARRKEEKLKKQAAAKERAAKKARRGSGAAESTTESSSESYTDYSSEESCDEPLRKIPAGAGGN